MNLLRKKIRNLKIWTAKELFKIFFRSFYYPFTDADRKFMELPKEEKIVYLSAIHQWVNSSAFKNESDGLIGKFYNDLALKTYDDVQVTGYRLALMLERDKQKRLLALDQQYNSLVK